eukprot:SAG11_NODE_6749_length_1254_cov_3.294372_1_plen_186_part_00
MVTTCTHTMHSMHTLVSSFMSSGTSLKYTWYLVGSRFMYFYSRRRAQVFGPSRRTHKAQHSLPRSQSSPSGSGAMLCTPVRACCAGRARVAAAGPTSPRPRRSAIRIRIRAIKVPYVDPPQLNAIRHAQVPGEIFMYNRRYRPKTCTSTFSIYCRYRVRATEFCRKLLLAETIAGCYNLIRVAKS